MLEMKTLMTLSALNEKASNKVKGGKREID
jgi:hypothetical protein